MKAAQMSVRQVAPEHPETRAMSAARTIYSDGYKRGHETGSKVGYMRGWRVGLFHGAFVAVVGGSLGVWVCKTLGWL